MDERMDRPTNRQAGQFMIYILKFQSVYHSVTVILKMLPPVRSIFHLPIHSFIPHLLSKQ